MENQKSDNSKEGNTAKAASTKEDLGFLFNVEILVRSETNAKALQFLLQALNQSGHIIDYKVNSGIELGTIIESLLSTKKQSIISKSYKRLNVAKDEEQANASSKTSSGKSSDPVKAELSQDNSKQTSFDEFAKNEEFTLWIQKFIIENRLVRLLVHRKGERMSIPCRILNYMSDTSTINVYHVDEKRVYNFRLNEIIDFIDIK